MLYCPILRSVQSMTSMVMLHSSRAVVRAASVDLTSQIWEISSEISSEICSVAAAVRDSPMVRLRVQISRQQCV